MVPGPPGPGLSPAHHAPPLPSLSASLSPHPFPPPAPTPLQLQATLSQSPSRGSHMARAACLNTLRGQSPPKAQSCPPQQTGPGRVIYSGLDTDIRARRLTVLHPSNQIP